VSTIASQPTHEDRGTGLRPALTAGRARLGLIVGLFGLAALAWWSTAERMGGMDDGPGTDLGAVGWFLGVWIVMMAAMMLPSVSPTVALYSRMVRSGPRTAPLVFASGYLATWAAAGLGSYGVFKLGEALLGDELAWDGDGVRCREQREAENEQERGGRVRDRSAGWHRLFERDQGSRERHPRQAHHPEREQRCHQGPAAPDTPGAVQGAHLEGPPWPATPRAQQEAERATALAQAHVLHRRELVGRRQQEGAAREPTSRPPA
jgi:hypothetical protein